MEYFYQTSIKFHLYLAILLAILTLLLLIFSRAKKTDAKYVMRIRYILPLFYSIIAALVISGFTISAAIYHFKLEFEHIWMIITSLLLIALNATGYKKLKISYINRNFTPYKRYMLINLLICMLAIFLCFIGVCSDIFI